MNIRAEPFWVPKQGNREEEYEDAVWPQEPRDYQESCIRFAVADGATESSYARQWAGLLVKAVGEGRLAPACLLEGIASLRTEWEQSMAGRTLPWYAEEKARQGAFAALVALELTVQESGRESEGCWHAAALGDSCLFHMRGEEVLAQFPLDNSAAFNSRPFLLGSVKSEEQCLADRISRRHGTWAQGDCFYLMTDALACWFLHSIEKGGSPWKVMRNLASPDRAKPFRERIEWLQEEGVIRNDDCTLLSIQVR